MDLTFALIGCGFALLFVGLYPFGPYQLSLMLARRLHVFPPTPGAAAPRTESGHETFAICLCASNEELVIREKVEDLLALRAACGGRLEILLYVDAAQDRTAEILSGYADGITLVVSPERRGKTHGMNVLVSKTSAAIIMFTDANVVIDHSAVAVLRRYFADPEIGCVCSDLHYLSATGSATAEVGAVFWRFNEWTKGLETATGSVMGADGSLFAIRRLLHRPVPDGLFDDIYVSLSVLIAGYRVVRAPELKAYEPHTTVSGDEFRRKIRIACECMHVHFALWPDIKRLPAWSRYKYLTHRLARWLSGYFLGASVVTFAGAGFSLFGAVPTATTILIGTGIFAATLVSGFGPAQRLWNIALAFLGTAVGVWRAFAGHRAVIWTVASSARPASKRSMTVGTDAKRASPGVRMRIALLDPGDFTPAYDEELAGGLCQLGHEVVLIGKHGGPLSSPEVRRPTFYALLARNWVRELPAAVARGVKGAHHIVDMARLIVLLHRMRPDVIHFQWMPLPLVDARFIDALRRIAPVVLTIHDSEPYQGATSRLMVRGFNRLIRAADAVIVHTRRTAEQLTGLGLDPELVHQVPHGLLHGQVRADPDRRRATDGRLRLLQFGKIKAYKGVDVLIEALGMLELEVRRQVHVRIVGSPYIDPQPLVQRARQLGVSGIVEFRFGFVSDEKMIGYFAEADAMVLPYRQIDASGVLMAALAHGLPVIASRIGDFAELLEDGREALLVPPGDAPALAAALTTLARSPDRLLAMRNAMQQAREAVLGWDEIAAHTVAVYEHARHGRTSSGSEAAQRPEHRVGVPAP